MWFQGGLAIAVLVSLIGLAIGGLIWLGSMLEPKAPEPGVAEPAASSGPEPNESFRSAPKIDEQEDFEGDPMPPSDAPQDESN